MVINLNISLLCLKCEKKIVKLILMVLIACQGFKLLFQMTAGGINMDTLMTSLLYN